VRVRCERTGICSRKTTGHLAHFVARPACNSLDLLGPGKKWLTTAGSENSRIRYRCLTVESSSRYETSANYITNLPKSESDLPEWQTAIGALMLCSRGGDPMLARIGVMRALNRHVERVFNPDRKDHHWGKRKIKRDE
jgi:hypothetical protein